MGFLGALLASTTFVPLVVRFLSSFGREGAGFRGRYSESGNLQENIRHIFDDPLEPLGLSYDANFFFGDSGPVEYALRGSILLPFVIYGLFALFLWVNARRVPGVGHLFMVTVLFEIGFTILTAPRFLAALPFFVHALNANVLTAQSVGEWSRRGSRGGST
jgi:amino acid transporter